MADKAIDLTKGLRAWAQKNGVTPAKFAVKTGYRYAYAWDILRGKGEFTQEGLGRFVSAYGIETMAEVLQLAGDERIVSITPTPLHKGEAGAVSVTVRKTPLAV